MAWYDPKALLEDFTEEDWLTSTSPCPTQELAFVTTDDPPTRRKSQPSNRKLRLFGCACCRRIRRHLSADWAQECLVVAEAYCEGLVGQAELKASFLKAPESLLRRGGWHIKRVAEAAGAGEDLAVWALIAARDICAPDEGMSQDELPLQLQRSHCPNRQDPAERAAQPSLLRDIYGNPFRLPAFSSNWRTADVVAIASVMYESHDFSSMPVLSDALQDAGCDDADILAHCRGSEPHVRGCWVVDLLLGRR